MRLFFPLNNKQPDYRWTIFVVNKSMCDVRFINLECNAKLLFFCTHGILAVSHFFDCIWLESLFSVYTWFLHTSIALLSQMAIAQTIQNWNWFKKKTCIFLTVKRGYYCIMLHWTQTNDDNAIVNSFRYKDLFVARNRRNIYHFKNSNQLNALIRNNWWQFGSIFFFFSPSDKWFRSNAWFFSIINQNLWLNQFETFWLMLLKKQ